MVKYFKINIARLHPKTGLTHYEYPSGYDAKKIQVMAYESSLPENDVIREARGNHDEFLIGAVADENAHIFDKIGVELTEEEIIALGNTWTKQIEKITDPNKVLAILAKVARKEKLSSKDEDSINPDKPEIGINKSKSFKDHLDSLKTHFSKLKAK